MRIKRGRDGLELDLRNYPLDSLDGLYLICELNQLRKIDIRGIDLDSSNNRQNLKALPDNCIVVHATEKLAKEFKEKRERPYPSMNGSENKRSRTYYIK